MGLRIIGDILACIGLLSLLASCVMGVGLVTPIWGFGLLIVGLLMIIAGRKAPAPASSVDTPHPSTHVRCPDCRELVRMDANKCKHCGAKLIPTREAEPIIHNPPRGIGFDSVIGTIVLIIIGLAVLSYLF
ncbi:zinc ribbon domain-containing protein [Roseateles cavernae]|uniref:zinc ribbon domain-containing protein n=1 Tax=Roseateles cavernae TaxID=3153578 RepID=UPI0032E4B5B0